MDDIFMMDKALMADVIKTIKALKVNVDSFEEADKWVGIVMLLEAAMNPPAAVCNKKTTEIECPATEE